MKKILAFLLAITCILSLSVAGFAQARWASVSLIDNTLKVKGRTASIMADVDLRTNDDCTLIVDLQRYDGKWKSFEKWGPIEGQGGCGVSATRALYPGYQYRLYLTITVTDHKTGDVIEVVHSASDNQPFVE